jgi:hypothetical protein
MERQMDEAEYVLAALYRMRGEVSTNPSLFDPDAQERIDEAIVRVEEAFAFTRPQLISSMEEKSKQRDLHC